MNWNWQAYSKFWVAAVGVVLTGLNVVYGDNSTVQLLIALAVAAGVHLTPNR